MTSCDNTHTNHGLSVDVVSSTAPTLSVTVIAPPDQTLPFVRIVAVMRKSRGYRERLRYGWAILEQTRSSKTG